MNFPDWVNEIIKKINAEQRKPVDETAMKGIKKPVKWEKRRKVIKTNLDPPKAEEHL